MDGWIKSTAGQPSCGKRMDITPLRIHSSLINSLNTVIFLRFCDKLKFHILSRDGKMIGLPPGIKISISSKSGHSTSVLRYTRRRLFF